MDFLVVTTESHRGVYEDFFLKTVPPDAVIREKKLGIIGKGEYLSPSWRDGVTGKLQWGLEHAENEPGSVFIFSDVDIQFFAGFRLEALREEFERSGADVLFQRETLAEPPGEVNTGFYIARGSPYFTGLVEDALHWCRSAASPNDQTAFNALLKPADFGRRWGVLSNRYYARSQGFPPKRDIVLHHANNTRTVSEKILQLRRVRRYVSGGRAGRWSALAGEAAEYALSGRLGGMLWRRACRMSAIP